MTTYALAVIDTNTEIHYMSTPGAIFDEEGPWKQNNDFTVVHIHSEVPDMLGFQQTQYYKGGEWKSREWKGEFYDWNGTSEEWEFNSSRFWEQIRGERNEKLLRCDWTQLPDTALSDSKKAEWAEYRQGLRGVPSTNKNATKPDDIIWPSQPS
tara:strand:+ start:2956 stop:3414 length:459 start_codon:yes stop_codon:yes gene_type:complete